MESLNALLFTLGRYGIFYEVEQRLGLKPGQLTRACPKKRDSAGGVGEARGIDSEWYRQLWLAAARNHPNKIACEH